MSCLLLRLGHVTPLLALTLTGWPLLSCCVFLCLLSCCCPQNLPHTNPAGVHTVSRSGGRQKSMGRRCWREPAGVQTQMGPLPKRESACTVCSHHIVVHAAGEACTAQGAADQTLIRLRLTPLLDGKNWIVYCCALQAHLQVPAVLADDPPLLHCGSSWVAHGSHRDCHGLLPVRH